MEEAELTAHLSKKFGQDGLVKLFERQSAMRQALKSQAWRASVIAAVVVALIWCKDDLDSGDYGIACIMCSL